MSKNTEIAVTPSVEIQNGILINSNVDLEASKLFDSILPSDFEEAQLNWFNPEEMGLLGVELDCVLSHTEIVTVKKENGEKEDKEFVVLKLRTKEGFVKTYAGQAQILSVFRRLDKGYGIITKITWTGKVNIPKTAKTMNNFSIKTIVLTRTLSV